MKLRISRVRSFEEEAIIPWWVLTGGNFTSRYHSWREAMDAANAHIRRRRANWGD